MDYPFYANRFGYPQSSRYYDHHHSPYSSKQVPVDHRTPPSCKVVMIPVTDGSERQLPLPLMSKETRLDGAVNIQKVFRGFMVRKSVKKIGEIKSEVDEIEKILMSETRELMRKDSKERLKVNEMLMRLLLRLDSVRGVDSGVRDLRRAVIKKVIKLQELVDSIVANNVAKDEDLANQTLETTDIPPNVEDSSFNSNNFENAVNQTQNHAVDSTCDCVSNVSKEEEGEEEAAAPAEELTAIRENVDVSECMEMSSSSGSSIQGESSQADSSDSLEKQPDDEKEVGDNEKDQDQFCGGEGNKEEMAVCRKSRELLEKMMEDNEKMMGLMTQLFQRNEMQTRLLSSLSQRVEQLERAFMCERSKRSKKKRHSAGLADCLESTQDCKKSSGKR
ncbi:hypothetical protein RCOM_1078930 [Ricinus communis]|uniref:BAG domain-containing protein n=1 Tax=Ricinus communis TaxID=3988 RepID=B9RMA2_RICCO|nr:hypothetical protein RCOM_1078930 [Ricinus communis]|eukprot:XP_002514871.1 uncharacterized protein LOC8286753 [Ricinus communis]